MTEEHHQLIDSAVPDTIEINQTLVNFIKYLELLKRILANIPNTHIAPEIHLKPK